MRPGPGVTPSDQLMKVFQAGLKQMEIEDQSEEKLKLHTADDADGLDLGQKFESLLANEASKISAFYSVVTFLSN